jgi:hypothetical protein
VRDVGEQRPERHDQLDAELLRQVRDLARERPPAGVRLDPEQEDRVALLSGDGGVVEDVLGPVDVPGDAVLEPDVRANGLEVVELLRVDVREALGAPALREEARGERGPLRAVVPATECCDEDRRAQGGPAVYAEMPCDRTSLRQPGAPPEHDADGERHH